MAPGAQIALRPSRAAQRIGATFAVALHAMAGIALLSYEPARSALLSVAPIMVELISPPKPAAKPPPEPPRPKPIVKPRPKPPEPLPLVTAPVEAPSPSPVVVPPPPPPPPPEAAAVVVAPPVITQPIYNADYLDNPEPRYPPVSKRNGEQGLVMLRVLVNAGGRADAVEIRRSSGYARLDEAARETVRGWRFVPAKRGGEPAAAWVLIPISFGIDKS
jgi:protein TonB